MSIDFKSKKGMSLVEMLVAIGIFTIGIAGFTMLFVRSWKSNSFIMEEGMDSIQASQTIAKISRQLRGIDQSATGEYMIKKADKNELVVYFDDDNDDKIERVRFYVDDDNGLLKKGVAKAGGSPLSYPADYNSDTEIIIARNVMNNPLSEPIFKYYDNKNNELVSPTLTDIRVIEVNLWINMKPLSAPDNVKIGTAVELRNLDEGI